MRRRMLLSGIACVTVVLFLGQVVANAQDPAEEVKKKIKEKMTKTGQGEGEMDPEMEAWMKISTPGEHHEHLKPLAGNWTYVSKWRMSPDQPWEESTGEAKFTWVLGGRFLHQQIEGEMAMGEEKMKFKGFGYTGYNNGTNKYECIWMDNMGTMMMFSEGTCDPSGKTITTHGECFCPMTGGNKKHKGVTKILGDDKHVFEMYSPGPDGEDFMTLEVTYTRK